MNKSPLVLLGLLIACGSCASAARPNTFALFAESGHLPEQYQDLQDYCYKSSYFTKNYVFDKRHHSAGDVLGVMLTSVVDLEREYRDVHLTPDEQESAMISEFSEFKNGLSVINLNGKVTAAIVKAGVQRSNIAEVQPFERLQELKNQFGDEQLLGQKIQDACSLILTDIRPILSSLLGQVKAEVQNQSTGTTINSLDCTISQRVVRAGKFCNILRAAPTIYSLVGIKSKKGCLGKLFCMSAR